MRSFRSKPVGWQHDSYRHYLAAKGYKTTHTRPGLVGYIWRIPIHSQQIPPNQAYPISPEDVKKRLGSMDKADLKGVTAIDFVQPKNSEQENAYAQYVRSKRKLLIFSQDVDGKGNIDGRPVEEVRKKMIDYVLPHEIGHHRALYKARITDKHIEMAEARADANVVGMDPNDRDVKLLRKY
jgi:hypothetical protein